MIKVHQMFTGVTWIQIYDITIHLVFEYTVHHRK